MEIIGAFIVSQVDLLYEFTELQLTLHTVIIAYQCFNVCINSLFKFQF